MLTAPCLIRRCSRPTACRRRESARSTSGHACQGARACEWLYVDFDDDLAPFYVKACGFDPTQAGLDPLAGSTGSPASRGPPGRRLVTRRPDRVGVVLRHPLGIGGCDRTPIPARRNVSIMDAVFDGAFPVHYGQAYILSRPTDVNSDLDEAFVGQQNGLLGASVRGQLWLTTGLHTGRVQLSISKAEAEPPLDDRSEEIVEATFVDGRPQPRRPPTARRGRHGARSNPTRWLLPSGSRAQDGDPRWRQPRRVWP